MPKRTIIEPGTKFGEWTVIEKIKNDKSKSTHYLCKCSCGNTSIVMGWQLRNNKSSKCKKCNAKLANVIRKIKCNEYIGVIKHRNSYYARINNKHIGSFNNELLAAQAYDEEARKMFGDKAILNFPSEDDF